MSYSKSLSRLLRRDLLIGRRGRLEDYKALLSTQRYNVSSNHECFEIQPYSLDEMIASHSGECGKFARAVLETLGGISVERHLVRHQAWPAVRLYYAAFYSAHLILRMFGRCCLFLDEVALSKLNEVSQLSNFVVKQGYYLASSEINILNFSKLKDSHKDTWSSLHCLFSDLRNSVVEIDAPESDRKDAIIQLGALMRCLEGGESNQSYLSNFRNRVQYRFEKSAWYPFGVKLPSGFELTKYSEQALKGSFNGVQRDTEISAFYDSCLSIASFSMKYFIYIINNTDGLHKNLYSDFLMLRNIAAPLPAASVPP